MKQGHWFKNPSAEDGRENGDRPIGTRQEMTQNIPRSLFSYIWQEICLQAQRTRWESRCARAACERSGLWGFWTECKLWSVARLLLVLLTPSVRSRMHPSVKSKLIHFKQISFFCCRCCFGASSNNLVSEEQKLRLLRSHGSGSYRFTRRKNMLLIIFAYYPVWSSRSAQCRLLGLFSLPPGSTLLTYDI